MNFCAGRVELMTRMVSCKWASSEARPECRPRRRRLSQRFGRPIRETKAWT